MSTRTGIGLDYVKTIGIVNNGLNGRGFANPYDLAVSRDGRIFVLNRCDPARASGIRVGVCNLDEEYLGEFGNGGGSGDGQFTWPVAIGFDSQERLYITDEFNQRVTVFSSSGEYLSKWGGPGAGQFNGPAGIAVGPNDEVYVVDQNNGRVQKFTTGGDFVLEWGSPGPGEGPVQPFPGASRPMGRDRSTSPIGGTTVFRNSVPKVISWHPSAARERARESFVGPPAWPWTPKASSTWPIGVTNGCRS